MKVLKYIVYIHCFDLENKNYKYFGRVLGIFFFSVNIEIVRSQRPQPPQSAVSRLCSWGSEEAEVLGRGTYVLRGRAAVGLALQKLLHVGQRVGENI